MNDNYFLQQIVHVLIFGIMKIYTYIYIFIIYVYNYKIYIYVYLFILR